MRVEFSCSWGDRRYTNHPVQGRGPGFMVAAFVRSLGFGVTLGGEARVKANNVGVKTLTVKPWVTLWNPRAVSRGDVR